MTDVPAAEQQTPIEHTLPSEPFRYPQDHVVAILDKPDQLFDAVETLAARGFLESEITVLAGSREADRLDASTGRTGLMHRILRIADRLGVVNQEIEAKERYEQALREDSHVVLVFCSSADRKRLAGDLLRERGGYFINYFGRFTIETLAP
jgi:hypothetical protein